MKILVTGAGGYLGQGIVKALLDRNNVVIATDSRQCENDDRAIVKTCDLFSVENPYEYFEQPDVLLHLAWRNGFVHNAKSHIIDLPLHFEFIDRMICGGCKRIAVMGTMHEIGFFEGSINENTPCNPMNLYGIAKCSLREITELMCKDNHVPLQWLRAFYIVGNTAQGSSVFSKIVQAEQKGDKFFPFTSGLNQYDFIDYDFFCKAVALTLEQDSVTGIINICSGRPQKLSERVERFLSENDFKIKLDYGRFAERPYDSKAIWGDDAKLSSILKMFE